MVQCNTEWKAVLVDFSIASSQGKPVRVKAACSGKMALIMALGFTLAAVINSGSPKWLVSPFPSSCSGSFEAIMEARLECARKLLGRSAWLLDHKEEPVTVRIDEKKEVKTAP